eukprot:CAMPEP_0115557242 /NCGR_PEP_ID=MMETSP0271-20121206/98807_1 /TAXON_ID=71861 /ORGANISM="Scrippsiella trochoidea, Strain CCMP3099" /LENGTH=105 /DNA_ID=CAMNT_0002991191 /DNA_START=364 /DNA_END=678 /DNA_ORIENTATION=-
MRQGKTASLKVVLNERSSSKQKTIHRLEAAEAGKISVKTSQTDAESDPRFWRMKGPPNFACGDKTAERASLPSASSTLPEHGNENTRDCAAPMPELIGSCKPMPR